MARPALGRPSVKVIVVGPSGVGKTSLIEYFMHQEFRTDLVSTIAPAFANATVSLPDKSQVDLQIWDTAGQEQYRSLGSTYFRNAHGAVLVFDLTVRESFTNCQYWIQSFRSVAGRDQVVLIIGNKTDLTDKRAVEWGEAADFGEANRCQYLETSALSGEGIDIAFETLIDQLLLQRTEAGRQQSDGIEEPGSKPDQPSKGCC